MIWFSSNFSSILVVFSIFSQRWSHYTHNIGYLTPQRNKTTPTEGSFSTLWCPWVKNVQQGLGQQGKARIGGEAVLSMVESAYYFLLAYWAGRAQRLGDGTTRVSWQHCAPSVGPAGALAGDEARRDWESRYWQLSSGPDKLVGPVVQPPLAVDWVSFKRTWVRTTLHNEDRGILRSQTARNR